MPKTSFSSMLPASFLEAVEGYRKNPLSYVRKDGSLAYLPFVGGGATDDDDAGTDDKDDGTSGKDGADDKGEGDNDTGDDEDDDDADGAMPDNIKAILRKNRNATRDAQRLLADAKKAQEAAEAKAKQYEDKDKSDLERLKGDNESLNQKNEKLEATNKRLVLQQAFLNNKSVAWVDPEDALDMALARFGLGDVEIGDAGEVDRKVVSKIIKEMAAEKKYLVKSEDATGEGSGTKEKQGASGKSYNSGKSGAQKGKDEAAMAKRYPAMGGRRPTG